MHSRTVGEVMTGDVVHARPAASCQEVARLLDRHRVGGLPVVDADDKVIGVVSRTDLVRHQATDTQSAPEGPVTAGGLMTTPAVTVHPEQRVVDAARIMQRRDVGRLPVVDEEDRLIGIATPRDLLRAFVRTDEEIRAEVAGDVLPRALPPASAGVAVTVHDGLVWLEGTVDHGADVPAAVWSVWRVDGVVGVVNRLTPRGTPAPAAPSPHGPAEKG